MISSNSVTYIEEDAFSGAGFIDAHADGAIYIDKCLYKFKGDMPTGSAFEVADGTTQICHNAFRGVAGLDSISVPNSVCELSAQAFYDCADLRSVTIGDGTETIGAKCFSGCVNLEEVAFGNAMNTIGEEAFYDCTKVAAINSGATIPPVCETDALASLDKYTVIINVPEGCITAYQEADVWKEFLYITGNEDVTIEAPDQLPIDGGVLHCNGIDSEVYNLSGVLVYSGNGDVQLATGTYIVVAAGRATKVAVK